MNDASRRLQAAMARRADARGREVARLAGPIARWKKAIRDALLPVVAAPAELDQRIERVARELRPALIEPMGAGFRRLWDWSWTTATRDLATALRVQGVVEASNPRVVIDKSDLRNAGGSPDKTAVKALLFKSPSKDDVNRILRDTTAPDGIAWEDRIKTVANRRLGQLATELSTRFAKGDDVAALTGAIEHFVGNCEWMARRIARTEGVRVAEAGLRETWDRAGDLIEGIQWFSAMSKWSRQDHMDRNLTVYVRQADGSFVAEDGEFSGEPLPTVPFGPNCVVSGQVVSGEFRAGLKVRYAGKVVEIVTDSGRTLAVTPNHRVLAVNGFVPAASICQGDHLLCHADGIKFPCPTPAVTDDIEQAPTTIEDVFRAFEMRSAADPRSKPSELDFHGDERFFQGDVDVVGAARELRSDGAVFQAEGIGERGFSKAGVKTPFLPSRGAGHLSWQRVDVPSPAMPSGFACSLDEDGAVCLVENRPLGVLRFGLCAESHARLCQFDGQAVAGNPDLVGELLERLPLQVSSDQVRKVRERNFSGHVYDLQTDLGWYACNGVIIHNCLCWTSPILAV